MMKKIEIIIISINIFFLLATVIFFGWGITVLFAGAIPPEDAPLLMLMLFLDSIVIFWLIGALLET